MTQPTTHVRAAGGRAHTRLVAAARSIPPIMAAVVLFLAIAPARAAAVTEGQWPGTSGPGAANSQYGYPYANPPACTDGGACLTDAWDFYQGQCTSWVAYRLNQLNGIAFNNNYGGRHWGNAEDWGGTAEALGIAVNGTPSVGSVAWYSSGHVAYVEEVRSPTSVVISEMNYDYDNGFRVRTITPSSGWPTDFIHIHDLASSSIGEGSFVSHDGFVYRIAGGAPIYVSNWNAVGGPQSATALSDAQFASLPQYPRDGTILDGSGGKVFVVAGGAPLYVSNWNAIGGPKTGVGVDEAAIDNAGGGVPWDHLLARPADGTLVASGATGMVYAMAGGAPLYVSNWAAIGGARSVTEIDQWDIDNASNPAAHLNTMPADGTLVASGATGMVYEIAGGAPLYVSNWAAIGGARSVTEIDQWDLDNITNEAAHMNAVPANGTLISSGATGMVYEMAGGAPLYVSNWAAIGGARSVVGVDQWDLDNIGNPAAHMNAVPSDGTLLGASGGGVFVVAGGAPMYLSSWNAIGGPQPSVPIDEWDIANIGNPAAHLNPVPTNGTFINTSTGHVYRIAGGAPFAVSSWSVFGGQQPDVTVDEWDIDNITNPAAHLNVTPANGTLVEGLPSDTYGSVGAGLRTQVSSAPGATTVDDFGLSAFPKPTPPLGPVTTHTETPSATPNPPGQPKATTLLPSTTPAHGVLGTKTSRPLKSASELSWALAKCQKIKGRRKRAKCEAAAKHRYHTTKKKKR